MGVEWWRITRGINGRLVQLHESREVEVNRRSLCIWRHRFLRSLVESEPTVLIGVVAAEKATSETVSKVQETGSEVYPKNTSR